MTSGEVWYIIRCALPWLKYIREICARAESCAECPIAYNEMGDCPFCPDTGEAPSVWELEKLEGGNHAN